MVFIVQQANNFCPAPWVGLYYHSNAASPCCTMATLKMSPKEYLESDWLKSLKQEFLEGKQSNHCNSCWIKERQGLKSIRNHFNQKFSINDITLTQTTKHLELRESNLCNFACRMCNPTDSVKIEREIEEYPELAQFYHPNTNSNMTDENWRQVLDVSMGLRSLYLTGGEPMLMKRYYDLLDHLIANGRNEDIDLRIYTNCSVYNPVFVEKLKQFKNVTLKLSIDAVGKTAEYQRYGTEWETVRTNIFKFLELHVSLGIHSTITAYSILDMTSLADFFVEVKNYEKLNANLTKFNAHVARIPTGLDYANLNIELRAKAIVEIDKSIEKLSDNFFSIYVKELKALRKQLLERRDCNHQLFVNMTKTLDKARNQSFEEVFGYKI
jgi:organic radical activating enzyme